MEFVVRQAGAIVATVEMVDSIEEAAETAAWLVFDRASVRKAAEGSFIAHGARRDGDDGQEVRFLLHRR